MYISRVKIKGITCFDDITIDFESNNDVIRIATILGDNGTGKTTIMRCIAMGLCDKPSAVGLFQELYGDWVNKNNKEGLIRIDFKSDTNVNKELYIERVFKKTPSGDVEIVDNSKVTEFSPWDNIFVCGYGAARGTFGTKDYGEYASVDSVYTLFNYDAHLQNPELIIRRIKDIDIDALQDNQLRSNNYESERAILKQILNWIDRIIDLPEGSTRLSKSGLEVSGPWGNFMPYMSLGDGYRATIALISDFLGWALFYDEAMFNKEISGIVLIDEIEQHLHPSWQRNIVRLLHQQFPKIQFIITTHSPLVAANTGKLLHDDATSKLFHLRYEGKYSQLSEVEENIGELNLDQILSSEAFDYIFDINPNVNNILREASILAAKDDRTPQEENKLGKFKEALREIMFPEGITLIERIIEKDYYEKIKNNTDRFYRILQEEE